MKKLALLAFGAACLSLSFQANAAPEPKKATAQVESKLYVTASEAWEMMQKDASVILIDVRDPIEVMFTGFTDEADMHVPFLLSDRSKKHPKKPVYNMVKNPKFLEQVEAKLTEMKVSKDTAIIMMCRSGSTRSAPAANMLYKKGWKNTYTMVDGFEGGKSKEGNSKGVRAVNGWRNSGLPWGYKLNMDKMYFAQQ
ncbi:rhodanese-like domain-containing protein [Terasakiella sp. SH-1]|uniref:rhodanese-like domain-containing protein n=1 Tax=Terasakiella sp. SH-1 TaxID=2560057 RepID=UPI0010744DE8|nr:rhodanese-like domain-containing protein [Terasakiella sp. SH-1]